MSIKQIIIASVAVAVGASLRAAVPEVSGVTMAQASDRLVTITYTLADAPAVITLDVQTNVTGDVWASIGGEAVWNAIGDVWKRVETGIHTITWQPDHSWPDHKVDGNNTRAVVTAWALENTPDYMVVDISASAQPNTQRYYPSPEFLPGGLLANTEYRTSSIVMRKIMAKDVQWTMGSTTLESLRWANDNREATHKVMLTNNYYIGVFEVTQSQWENVATSRRVPSYFQNAEYRAMRSVEKVSYNEIRMAANGNNAKASDAKEWPEPPYAGSFLDLLRTKTGIDFDLPGEAQWEFAARAGNGNTKWNDGSGIKNTEADENLDVLGRYNNNGGASSTTSSTAANGTAIVGTYKPNSWGLYDMHGNVWEWCLDGFTVDITSLNGGVYTGSSAQRVRRGGSHLGDSRYCRSAYRGPSEPTVNHDNTLGVRLACRAGLR